MSGTYNFGLVTLSVLVAVLASYTTLDVARRVSVRERRSARIWLLGGALSMGAGIWSMHFIGMLAFTLPIPVAYDLGATAASFALAVIVSGFALTLVSSPALSTRRLFSGALLMGLGIAGMHYLGMAAMPMSIPIRYDPLVVAASIAIAVAASAAALWVAFRLRAGSGPRHLALRLVAASIMGAAIAGMHYTGMAAANFDAGTVCLVQSETQSDWLGMFIGLASASVLGLTLVASVLNAELSVRTQHLVTRLSAVNSELQFRATHDPLTGLANRALLDDRLARELATARRLGGHLAVIFVELDRFKSVNDSFGHHAGDLFLKEMARRLPAALRAQDSVARVGGDEFIVILPAPIEPGEVAALARGLLASIGRPFGIEGTELHLSASIGIALYPNDGEDAHALLVSADAALTHVKRSGRGDLKFFAPAMNVRTRDQFEFENEIWSALEDEQFVVYYQPKFEVASGALIGMEALLRWDHPTRGIVGPSEFIPVAEETGLIVPLGAWVLEAACRQNRQWQDEGLPKVRVAVNLSATQFRQPRLLDAVRDTLTRTGLAPRYLELELTESTVMHNASDAAFVLRQLTDLGVHVSIDDFGTGYSSLSHLKRFPLDKLKIDRSFIDDTPGDAEDVAIVTAIVSLAHSLRLKVIAEGVETEAQLALLRELGCDEFQGYLGGRPLCAAQFRELLRARERGTFHADAA